MNERQKRMLEKELEVMQLERKLDHALERLAELKAMRVPPSKRALYTRFLARLAGEIEEMDGLLRVAREE